MGFDTPQLPMPTRVNERDLSVIHRSRGWRDGGLLLSNEPDENVPLNSALYPRAWELVYQRARGNLLRVLQQHYDEFFATAFEWTPPGGADALMVIYEQPTTIQWDTAVMGSARVFLEEPMAH